MSLRSLLATLLFVALVFASAFTFYSSKFLEERVIAILPPSVAVDTSSAIHLLLIEQSIAVFAFSVIASALLFWIIGSLVATPLRKLVEAMSAFAADGTRLQLPAYKGVPSEIHKLVRVFMDFTEKVEIAHKKDTEISRVKSDFISTAAHQLRTPLTGIRWALEALQKEKLTEDQQALIKNAVDKSHDLVAIVGTLLDISSIESGKYKYEFAPTDMDKIISEVAQDFSPLAQKGNVSLFYAKEETPLPLVRADQERIKWVLNNLVENAIRYTPAGGTVRITTEAPSGVVLVHVHDTGIGILSQDRENIFERFYRAGNAIAKENQGNGLGLYIARTIATDHGGDLNFTPNESGPGTTFTLSLPVV